MTAVEFALMAPEILLLTMACIILLVDIFFADKIKHIAYWLSQGTLIALIWLTWATMATDVTHAYADTFVRDTFSDVLKIFTYLVTIAVLMYSRNYMEARNFYRGEYFVLALFSVLGMMVMISSHHMITMYIGLEIMSLAMYAMIAMQRRSSDAQEAAMKYFVLGALASGLLLYGMSMLYGATGTLSIPELSKAVMGGHEYDLILSFGIVFIVIGLAFKLGAVPFHMWLPDVYAGSPTAVTLFISAAPKIAAFAMMFRLLIEGLEGMASEWQTLLIVMSVLSMIIGNVIAIAQKNVKRMLAYSTIAHVGFVLLGFIAMSDQGYAASMYYVIVYAITAAAGFGMLLYMAAKGMENDTLDDFKGLNDRSPWFAFMMLIVMFSMAGVPPTVGFYAKVVVLNAVVQAGLVWLAVLAVALSIIGLFYYLRLVKYMYFDAPEGLPVPNDRVDAKLGLSVNSLSLLGLGILPGPLLTLCISAVA